jgi:phosphohistidine phosphatase
MGRLLSKQGVQPDLLISSPAKRATETARQFANELNISADNIRYEKNLYMANSEEIIEIIRNLDGDLQTVMLFGHNPGLTDAVNKLSDFHIDNVPTCGVVLMQTDSQSWKDIATKRSTFVSFEYPKKYL